MLQEIEPPTIQTVRRHDLTLTSTTLHVSVKSTIILKWVQSQLDGYSVPEPADLHETTWEDGHLLLALAHKLSPDPKPDFSQWCNQYNDPAQRTTEAHHVFEQLAHVTPPSSQAPLPVYLAHIYQTFAQPTPQHTSSVANAPDHPWMREPRVMDVLASVQNARQQIQRLVFRPSSSSTTSTADPPLADHPTKHWLNELDTLEKLLHDADLAVDQFHAWAAVQPIDDKERKAMIQYVDQAFATLQEYLERDQPIFTVYRKRADFHQRTVPIYECLDWIQAQMLKTTTTDNGIQKLEQRLDAASALMDDLLAQYHDPVEQNEAAITTEVDMLRKRHTLVQSWVEDVRVWFVEAQRISQWIEAHIHTLEAHHVPDGLDESPASLTLDQVIALIADHDLFEKQVETFDREDMSRLRHHVKTLTSASIKDKDLSPADTTTIEITFTTLTTLDRLMYLMRQKSYELQILSLRLDWQHQSTHALTWVTGTAQSLDQFIETRARWHDHLPLDKSMIDALLEFEQQISGYDQGPFTDVVNKYQELDDLARVELPSHLEASQVRLEETFEALIHQVTFARHVVEQHLAMHEFMQQSCDLIQLDGRRLSDQLQERTHLLYTSPHAIDSIDLLDETSLVQQHAQFHQRSAHVMSAVHSNIPTTRAVQRRGEDSNDQANEYIHTTSMARNTELLLFAESLELKLSRYRAALQWYNKLHLLAQQLDQVQTSVQENAAATTITLSKLIAAFGDDVTVLQSEWLSLDQDGDDNMIQRIFGDDILRQQNALEAAHSRCLQLTDQHAQLVAAASPGQPKAGSLGDADGLVPGSSDGTPWMTHLSHALQQTSTELAVARDTCQEAHLQLAWAKSRRAWEMEYTSLLAWLTVHQEQYQHILDQAYQHQRPDAINDWLTSQSATPTAPDHPILTLQQEWQHTSSTTWPSFEALHRNLQRSTPALDLCYTQLATQVDQLQHKHAHLAALWKRTDALVLLHRDTDHLLAQGSSCLTSWAATDPTDASSPSPDTMASALQDYRRQVTDLWQQWQGILAATPDFSFGPTTSMSTTPDLSLTSKDGNRVDVQLETASKLHRQLLEMTTSLEAARHTAMVTKETTTKIRTLAAKLHQVMDKETQRLLGVYQTWASSMQKPHKSMDDVMLVYAWARPLYSQTTKDLAACKQVLPRLDHDLVHLKDDVTHEACKTAMMTLTAQYQHLHVLLDLVRRVLGLGKSSRDIMAWFGQCQDTLQRADHSNEDGLKSLHLKLQGFQPIITSLENMHDTAQLPVTLPDTAEGCPLEEVHSTSEVIAHWQTLAHQTFSWTKSQWQQCNEDLASAMAAASASTKATLLARKIRQIMATVANAQDRLVKVEARSFCSDGALAMEDDGEAFNALPRHVDMTDVKQQVASLMTENEQIPTQLALLAEQLQDPAMPSSLSLTMDELQATAALFDQALTIKHVLLPMETSLVEQLQDADDLDGLLEAMAEVITMTAPHYRATMLNNHFSRAELKAKLIELDAKYNYYHVTVQKAFDKLQQHPVPDIPSASSLPGSHDRVCSLEKCKQLLAQHQHKQQVRWRHIFKQTQDRRDELKSNMASIPPPPSTKAATSSTTSTTSSNGSQSQRIRARKSSLPTRKASALSPAASNLLFADRSGKPSNNQQRRTLTPPPNGNVRRTMTPPTLRHVSSAMHLNDVHLPIMPSSRYLPAKSSSTTTASMFMPSSSLHGWSGSKLRMSSTRPDPAAKTIKKKRYVAQSDNLLDAEIARIVNAAPYDVKVKMVPGEVGRYLFGEVKPKLVYCRVLQSRMVMVRVGGGWSELSQFLRDHALLEGAMIIPEKQRLATMQEVYLKASKSTPLRSLNRSSSTPTSSTSLSQSKQHQKQSQQDKIVDFPGVKAPPTPPPTSSVTSTSSVSSSTRSNLRAGYKDGDNYIAIDQHGNQLQVKMTKFRSSQQQQRNLPDIALSSSHPSL